MSNIIKTALLMGGLLWQSMGLASDTGWLASPQNDHAKVRLQADTRDPAQTRVLLSLELESGWKTYWQNPGEGGIAPEIFWDAPQATQQWHWPVPERFDVSGISTQGYQKTVSFPIMLAHSSNDTLTGTLRLSTCSNVCILTDYPFTLALDGTTPEGFDFAYAQAMSKLPQALPDTVILKAGYQQNQLQLTANNPQGWQDPQVFLQRLEGAEFGKPELEVQGNTLIARIPVSDGWQGDAPDISNQQLGFVLSSGEQAWQSDTSIGDPLTLPQSAHSLVWLLGAALLGGLILNLMPCVLPVLALKLGSVLQLETRERRPVRLQFLAASAGILVSFWALALMSTLLRATQGAVGWGIQFQSVWFIGFMVVVTLLFCANLLGLFELRLPSNLNTRLATTGGNSLGGHFLQGCFATLLATPCSAPFLGTAVAFALGAPLGQLWLIFTALGLGMSLPWLLIAAFPRLALWLPKPGRWMGRLRILLGLMMLGSSLWLLSLLGNHIGQFWMLILMALMLAVLLLAVVWRHGIRGVTLGLALTCLVGGALLLGGAFMMEGKPQRDTVNWQPLSEQAIVDALAQNKRVFVDVTADWCITCKANKFNVLLRDDVQKALSAPDVVALRGDWSRPSASIADFLRQRGSVAIPFNQIYGPGLQGGEILSPLLDRPTLLGTLKQAAIAPYQGDTK
ncbi:protein-disulfide reductase DsbD family protein [Aeromonas salmonicida]|uniref:protein-disulfide reductase DsbD family protein n=1 Tax=Aeromonas salmonicida TaxID=645 RepID=UPI00259F3C73|nr:protein-disulfide reductase DsbD domain-containing protein [Aeromonas salmonicida]MDM5065840.1 protein-disulfide reductase DsbD family protein [Aeromonas salmonicida]